MKYSQFNSIISYKKRYVLFNSLTLRSIFLVPDLKELLIAAINEGIEELNNYHPSFYDYLCEQEFIVHDSIDEVEKVRMVVKSIDENNNSFILTVNSTMNCNFKCWYCYETHIKDSKIDRSSAQKIKKFIDNITSNNKTKNFTISFFGGEPLLYFKKTIVPLLDYYIAKCDTNNIRRAIGITTNGYMIDRDFINYFKEKNETCQLQITLDGNKEEHDKVRFVSSTRGSYDKIVENIKLLANNGFYVSVRINFTDKNIYSTKEIINDFEDVTQESRRNLSFDFHRVWQNENGENIDEILEDLIQSYKIAGFQVLNKYSRDNVRDSCYADKINSATINYNGDIYKCTARDFTKENREGYINNEGELIWENNLLEKRMSSKFKNNSCLNCRIMPLCNGGCSQIAMENSNEDYCVYNGDEKEKDRIVEYKIIDALKKLTKREVSALVES